MDHEDFLLQQEDAERCPACDSRYCFQDPCPGLPREECSGCHFTFHPEDIVVWGSEGSYCGPCAEAPWEPSHTCLLPLVCGSRDPFSELAGHYGVGSTILCQNAPAEEEN